MKPKPRPYPPGHNVGANNPRARFFTPEGEPSVGTSFTSNG
jgi:hypothetical protein